LPDGEGAQRPSSNPKWRSRQTEGRRAPHRPDHSQPRHWSRPAFAGGDPNGPASCRQGAPGVKFDPHRGTFHWAGNTGAAPSSALNFNERAASNRLLEKQVQVVVDFTQDASPRASDL